MHIFHYFTIYHFAQFLNQEIQNSILVDCFSQNKEELVLHFQAEDDKFLIIHCDTSMPFYYLTSNFHRANKNSITLFDETLGLKVIQVEILEGERVIIIYLENHHQIVLKLFGKLSNVIHYYYNQMEDIFRHSLQEDLNFTLKPNPSFQFFLDYLNNDNLTYEQLLQLPYWDRTFKNYILNAQNQGLKAIEMAIEIYNVFLSPTYYVSKTPLDFLIIKNENIDYQTFSHVNEALNFFVKTYFIDHQFQTQYQEILKQVENQIKNFEYKVNSNIKSIENIKKSRSYEEIANILMANLHLDIKNQEKYTFQDFYYHNEPVTISLKPDLTLQQNADLYYQKNKKQKKELSKLENLLSENQSKLGYWLSIKKELQDIQDLKSLQKWLKKYPELNVKKDEKSTLSLPYREFVIDNFKIWVGKDAKSNDELTLRYSHKNDIWLHAKDVSGSHVLIKTQKSHQVPKQILIHAAELAGFYSKNRNQNFIPVIYTEKKYVRKGKGLPPGKVIVERENIIFVTPKSYEQIMENKKI